MLSRNSTSCHSTDKSLDDCKSASNSPQSEDVSAIEGLSNPFYRHYQPWKKSSAGIKLALISIVMITALNILGSSHPDSIFKYFDFSHNLRKFFSIPNQSVQNNQFQTLYDGFVSFGMIWAHSSIVQRLTQKTLLKYPIHELVVLSIAYHQMDLRFMLKGLNSWSSVCLKKTFQRLLAFAAVVYIVLCLHIILFSDPVRTLLGGSLWTHRLLGGDSLKVCDEYFGFQSLVFHWWADDPRPLCMGSEWALSLDILCHLILSLILLFINKSSKTPLIIISISSVICFLLAGWNSKMRNLPIGIFDGATKFDDVYSYVAYFHHNPFKNLGSFLVGVLLKISLETGCQVGYLISILIFIKFIFS